MDKIAVGRLFEFYLDTVNKCGDSIKKLSDDMIGYYIFEDFIIGITSYLEKCSLDKLIEDGIIDEEIYSNSVKLRSATLELEGTDSWNVISVKNSIEWDRILKLSDKIKQQLNDRWTEEDIQHLLTLK